MKDRTRKLYLTPECLSLTDAQLKFVERSCITQLLGRPVNIVRLAAVWGFVAGFHWLGMFRDNGRFGGLSPLFSFLALMLLSLGLARLELRRKRPEIAAYVRNNMVQIEAAGRHPGVRADCVPILEHPEYGRFIAEDPERRYIYWEDLPKRFCEWIRTQNKEEEQD